MAPDGRESETARPCVKPILPIGACAKSTEKPALRAGLMTGLRSVYAAAWAGIFREWWVMRFFAST